ncbi:MAG: DUF6702 family protein [Bacteroidota bacterium]
MLILGVLFSLVTGSFPTQANSHELKQEHKFYFSHTIMEENEITGSLEITMEVFTDDLEKAIQDHGEPFRLGDERERDDANARIEEYLRTHFILETNNGRIQYRFLGKEVENETTFCYLEVSVFQGFSMMEITNSVFHGWYPEQENRVTLKANGFTKSVTLTKDRPTQQIFN